MVQEPQDFHEFMPNEVWKWKILEEKIEKVLSCLLYTSDAADDLLCVDLGGRRIIKKKKEENKANNTIDPKYNTQYNNRITSDNR